MAGTKAIGVVRCVYVPTAEIVRVVLGDDPAGELEEQLGTKDEPAYQPNDEIMVVGTWRKEWLVATAIGKPTESASSDLAEAPV